MLARPENVLPADLGDQIQRTRRIGGRLQHGAQADAWHVLRQQQIALQRDRIDRLLLGEPVEEAQHLGAGRADVAIELDAGDAALGDDEAQSSVVVEIGRNGGEHIAVGAVALQDRLARGVDLRQRHRRSDQARGKLRNLRLRIGGDAFDSDTRDPHRPVRHLGTRRGWRRHDRAGRYGRRCGRQHARDRRTLRHGIRRDRLCVRRRDGSNRAYKDQHGHHMSYREREEFRFPPEATVDFLPIHGCTSFI